MTTNLKRKIFNKQKSKPRPSTPIRQRVCIRGRFWAGDQTSDITVVWGRDEDLKAVRPRLEEGVDKYL